MSTEEINGFLVDKFNQHSLKEGAAQGVCPLCSSDRKPKNAKAAKTYLGNVKIVWTNGTNVDTAPRDGEPAQQSAPAAQPEADLPF